MMSSEQLDLIRGDLASLSERLADVALDLLHEAMADPDPKQSVAAKQERLVTRARRSVEKADQLLRSIDRGS